MSETLIGKVQYASVIDAYILSREDGTEVGSILEKFGGKTVRITIDEVNEFAIQRGDVTYTIRIFPEKFEVVRAWGEVAAIHTFLTDEIGPEYVPARQYKSAIGTVLKMLDGIDKKC